MHRNCNKFLIKPGESVTYTSWPDANLREGYGFAKRKDSTSNTLIWGTADGSQKKFIMCQKSEFLLCELENLVLLK